MAEQPARAHMSLDWIPSEEEMRRISQITPEDVALPFPLVSIAERPPIIDEIARARTEG